MPKFEVLEHTFLVAIVFYQGNKTRKYRWNIKNNSHYRRMFKNFISKNNEALYINYYHKHDNTFSDRVYIKQWDKNLKQWV